MATTANSFAAHTTLFLEVAVELVEGLSVRRDPSLRANRILTANGDDLQICHC
jgi:hypothetical protein